MSEKKSPKTWSNDEVYGATQAREQIGEWLIDLEQTQYKILPGLNLHDIPSAIWRLLFGTVSTSNRQIAALEERIATLEAQVNELQKDLRK